MAVWSGYRSDSRKTDRVFRGLEEVRRQREVSPRPEATHPAVRVRRRNVRFADTGNVSATPWSYCAPSVTFAALAARAFARFATSAAFRAGDSFFFAISFFSAGFFACFAAWN